MGIFSFKTFMVALATVFYLSFAFSTPISSTDANTNQLRVIGTIEGKTYFAEENINATWDEARKFCVASGMHLATVTTVAQQKLLADAYNNVTFHGRHWTAGHDRMDQAQYKWNNDEVLNSSVVSPYMSENGMRSCICFEPYSKYYFSNSCTYPHKILCELIHGKSSS